MNLFVLHSLTSVPVREREREMERDKIVRAFFKLKWVRTHKKSMRQIKLEKQRVYGAVTSPALSAPMSIYI